MEHAQTIGALCGGRLAKATGVRSPPPTSIRAPTCLLWGLALHPRLLILDEPTQGLSNAEITGFKALVRAIVPKTTVLLIEHNMDVVMDLADQITVLNMGETLATGTPATIQANAAVQSAYLGG